MYNSLVVKFHTMRNQVRSIVMNKYKISILALAIAVLSLSAVTVLKVTAPRGEFSDGTEVEDPRAIKAAGKEIAVVENDEAAKNVIKTVIEKYFPEGAQVNTITVDKKLIADDKPMKRKDEPVRVLTEAEAVENILNENKGEDPLFTVTVNAEKGSLKKIKAEKEVRESDDMYKGDTEVRSEGVSGDQIVTKEVVCVNGVVINSKTVDRTVVKDKIDKLVLTGMKDRPYDTAWADYSGEIMGNGSGEMVVAYAKRFCGNPYVYGGNSLTGGTDCSGFVQGVYARFGISLPRTAYAQARCGKGVSFSEAKAGDLILYPGHIGIYIGGGRIVHASNSRRGICISGVRECGPIWAVRRIID